MPFDDGVGAVFADIGKMADIVEPAAVHPRS